MKYVITTFNSQYRLLLLIACVSSVFALQAQSNLPLPQNAPVPATAVTPPSAYSTDIPLNYVRVWQPLKPFTTESDVISTQRQVTEVNRSTQYIDGLGRSLQIVSWQASPGKNDVVAPIVYDEFGREKYKYLPYTDGAANNGLLKSNPFADQVAFYTGSAYTTQQPALKGENIFYSQINYEVSPLNRVEKSMAAGNSWAGSDRGVQMKYTVNTDADKVRVWNISFSTDLSVSIPLPYTNDPYAAGELHKNVTIDENGKQVVEYTDKQSLVVLKKVQMAATPGLIIPGGCVLIMCMTI